MTKMLLVDDSNAFRQTIKNILLAKFPSLRIVEAADGQEALREVRCDCPQMVLMDIRLPGPSGLELTREIKQLCSQVTIIILTDYNLPEYREAASQYGADYFLVKGLTKADEILEIVGSLAGM